MTEKIFDMEMQWSDLMANIEGPLHDILEDGTPKQKARVLKLTDTFIGKLQTIMEAVYNGD